MNLIFSHITTTIGRFWRSLKAAPCALSCFVGADHQLQPVRPESGLHRSPVRRSLSMKALHRLGRVLLVSFFLLSGTATSHGYNVDNIATLDYSYGGIDITMNSNTATVSVSPPPSAAAIELLRHATDPAGTYLPSTEYGDSAPPTTFSQVLPLPGTGVLSAATSYGKDEMAVVRVTDSDRNNDPSALDTVLVRLSSSTGGDAELLRITESGPDTGIFIGYIHLANNTPVSYNGSMSVSTDDLVQVDYLDPVNGDTASATSLVDPYGFVFDSQSAAPVDGMEIMLIDAATGLEATNVVGDDGEAYPGRVVTGGTVTTGSRTYNFPPGGYRFPSIPPGDYRLEVVSPTGYAFPSAAASPAGSYTVVSPGSYGGSFAVSSPEPIRIDVPIDPAATADGLWLQLSSDRALVANGDVLSYSLRIENTGMATVSGIETTQTLPTGFRYLAGSTAFNGTASADPAISANGDSLSFPVGDIDPGETVEIIFRAMVGAVGTGEYPSEAIAQAASGQSSNLADATVRVRDELGTDESIIAGRVLAGCGESLGVEGVRIFLEDGTYVITDGKGRYHVEGVDPGLHVVQIDPVTFPDGYEPVLCEEDTRSAGSETSRFVELQPGSLWRADFTLSRKQPEGEISIALNNNYAIGSAAVYTVRLSGRDVAFSNQRLEIELPPEATYLPGSTVLDDRALPDPRIDGRVLTYSLPDRSGEWQSLITFRTLINQESETGEMPAQARLHFDIPGNAGQVTPPSESSLVWISRAERAYVRKLVLRPSFGTLEATLSPADLSELDRKTGELEDLNLIRIFVTGHTDARRILWRDGVPYKDNFELSQARAEAVADALRKKLDLDPDQVVIVGMGDAVPIADNDTDAGRAMNRRTELTILHRVLVDPENEKVAANGGQNQTYTPARSDPSEKAQRDRPIGIVSPVDGQNLAQRIESVKVRLDKSLKPKLSLDGREIPADRIGFRLGEPENGTQLMTFIGIDFGDPGRHVLKIEGIGPFGNARFEQTITLNRTGEIARLEVLENDGNVADGRTPVRIRLALYDAAGDRISEGGKLEVRAGNLTPLENNEKHLPKSAESNLALVDANGIVRFEPVNQAGVRRLVLGFGEIEVETDVYISPEKRNWILVGLGEGTAGYNDISGNIHPLDPNAPREDFFDDGRLAFFAKGQVKGEWLLTLAYDSDKEDRKGRTLHQVIDPERFYTVYADGSQQGYEAASAEKLFIRIERERFFALFGDIVTGMDVTELARYSRSLTGVKSEWNGRTFGYTAFASETAQKFVRDEIRGDGTSGLYRLSRSDIVINSEKITLETRDRFHSEQIVETRNLQRHIDYDIDYEAGTLYFKKPVQSRDRDLNPIYITVDYETTARGEEDYTWGGRVYGRMKGGDIEIGASVVHEGQNIIENDLVGVDASIRLTDRTTIQGEWATSESSDPTGNTEGDAWLAEIEHRSTRYDLSAYMREQEAGFGLGQLNAGQSGTRKTGADLRYRVNRRLDINTEVYQHENLANDLKRNVGEASVDYHGTRYSLSAGLRHAEDDLATGASEISDQVMLGADYHVTDRLDLTLRHEQSMSDNENRDYPTRTLLGADYVLNRSVSLFLEQEITQGEAADTATTRAGLDTAPWDGAQVRTSMEQKLGEAGRRVFANLGLLQSWQINPKLAVSFSIDRSELLSGQNLPSFQSDQPPASGSSEDFTALSTGLSYRESDWTFDTRLEYRTSDSEEKWGLFAGSIVEPETFLGLSLHGRYFNTDRSVQGSSSEADLSFGVAYRPDNRSWIILNRLDLAVFEDETATSKTGHWKVIERLNAFWRANAKNRLAFKFGTRYAADEFDSVEYSGMTWLFGSEWRHDISKKVDVGLHGSVLSVQELSQSLYHAGASVGYSPARNFWISLGYNFDGFRDEDFSRADYTARGPYIKFRFKFDQNSVRDALEWLQRN